MNASEYERELQHLGKLLSSIERTVMKIIDYPIIVRRIDGGAITSLFVEELAWSKFYGRLFKVECDKVSPDFDTNYRFVGSFFSELAFVTGKFY